MPSFKQAFEPIYNDPGFQPSHDTPVLYVHGIASRASAFRRNARYLREHGYWVWGYDYGTMVLPGLYGGGDLDDLVAELAGNVERVCLATGASQIDIVAHSQGGFLTKLFIASGGAGTIRRVVTMGAPFHGTDFNGRADRLNPLIERRPQLARRLASPSALQQLTGSYWHSLREIVPDTDPRVVYTSLYSTRDRLATPISTSILEPVDGADVANVEIPGAPLHPLMPRDEEIARLTRWGLERPRGETTPPAFPGPEV